MNEEEKVYAQIAKDQIDANTKNDKDWQDFLKLKQQAINQYGDNNVAKLVYGEREAALLSDFKQRQEKLDALELDRWDNYHNGQTLETPVQSSPERDLIDEKSQSEKTAQAYAVNRKDILGEDPGSKSVKERTQLDEPDPTSPGGLDKTAANFEQLLKSQRTDQQNSQIDRNGVETIDVDKAYNKTVTVEFKEIKEETKQERIERKMREWEEAQKERTQQRSRSQEM